MAAEERRSPIDVGMKSMPGDRSSGLSMLVRLDAIAMIDRPLPRIRLSSIISCSFAAFVLICADLVRGLSQLRSFTFCELQTVFVLICMMRQGSNLSCIVVVCHLGTHTGGAQIIITDQWRIELSLWENTYLVMCAKHGIGRVGAPVSNRNGMSCHARAAFTIPARR
jgi:hypothetical protein